ncbi:Pyruvate decarboxylase 1 [Exophiala xenobiotica]|nr:Pyruvate decarboxylase 1 [Exophiala xenobiotica]
MGVPGDMNLDLLDYVKEVPGLKWITPGGANDTIIAGLTHQTVGNANELNAAYAADGYARIKGCPGVLVTTMGVGELSAINGIGGAYTEQVKVIHIVGTTARAAQEQRLMIHHCMGPNPDHKIYEKMSAPVRCAHAWLDDEKTVQSEIDRVIRQCWIESLPAYLFVPMDMVRLPVSLVALNTPVDIAHPVNTANEDSTVTKIKDGLVRAKRPVILVDCLTARHEATKEARQLCDMLDLPIFTTPMGKTIIDETHSRYCGVYNGSVSYPGIKEEVEGSDCVLNLGPLLSDSNSGGHTRQIDPKHVILVEPASCTVFGEQAKDVYLRPLLAKLLVALKDVQLQKRPNPTLPPPPPPPEEGPHATRAAALQIRQDYIWKRIGRFSRPGDIVIGECGTAQFGLSEATFAANATYVTQLYYGSIGYSVPCCLGAGLAQRELLQLQSEGEGKKLPAPVAEPSGGRGRLILVVGDGSLQLTVQEIGTIIKQGLKPIIFLINNDGYTIERAIHGPDESYNDITTWDHSYMLQFFGVKMGDQCTRLVRTREDMEVVLHSAEVSQQIPSPSPSRDQNENRNRNRNQNQNQNQIQLVEVFMDRLDIPWPLAKQIEIINERMRKARGTGTTG